MSRRIMSLAEWKRRQAIAQIVRFVFGVAGFGLALALVAVFALEAAR